MKRKNYLILLILFTSFTLQAQFPALLRAVDSNRKLDTFKITEQPAYPLIPINFHRFGTDQPDWNNANGDPRVEGRKLQNLNNENGEATGYELWVDKATSDHFLVGAHAYAQWPSNVSS